MKLKLSLATATAVGLLMGAAHAQSNSFETDQDGAGNTISIEQAHTSSATGANIAGDDSKAIHQDGDNNEINVDQLNTGSGSNSHTNFAGTGSTIAGHPAGAGIDQLDNGNILNVDQNGYGLRVFDVQQDGHHQATGTSNSIDITQTGGRSVTSNLGQTFRGGAADDENRIVIDQSGSLNYVGHNTQPKAGWGIFQNGNGNSADVTQSGQFNQLRTLNQWDSVAGSGSNTADVMQSGEKNHIDLIDQTNNGGTDNGVVATQFNNENAISNITQIGSGNSAIATQSGDRNTLTLLSQDGMGNMATTSQSGSDNGASVSVQGDGNITDILQTGIDRDATIEITRGFSNDVSITQGSGTVGVSNTAGINIDLGTSNLVDIIQDGNNTASVGITNGDDNGIAVDQSGYNTAAVAITGGDRNFANIDQTDGSGGLNSVTLTITGDDNNNYFPTSSGSPDLSGVADMARDSGLNLSSNFSALIQGDLFQNGSDNSIDLTVGSNSNAFAMLQDGSHNSISGTISGGAGGNQAVIVQVSSNNAATFAQSGSGNVLGAVQGGSTTGNF